MRLVSALRLEPKPCRKRLVSALKLKSDPRRKRLVSVIPKDQNFQVLLTIQTCGCTMWDVALPSKVVVEAMLFDTAGRQVAGRALQ